MYAFFFSLKICVQIDIYLIPQQLIFEWMELKEDKVLNHSQLSNFHPKKLVVVCDDRYEYDYGVSLFFNFLAEVTSAPHFK